MLINLCIQPCIPSGELILYIFTYVNQFMYSALYTRWGANFIYLAMFINLCIQFIYLFNARKIKKEEKNKYRTSNFVKHGSYFSSTVAHIIHIPSA